MRPRVHRVPDLSGSYRLLAHGAAVLRRRAISADRAAAAAERVRAAAAEWTTDFEGAQHSLGRAFYTHFETDRALAYFAQAEEADRVVERHLPGLQALMRSLFAEIVAGNARQRRGYCGAGVHIFPSGGELAARGGVVHYDVEGLTPLQLQRRSPTLTLVLMLQPPARGGGLRLFDARFSGQEHPSDDDLCKDRVTVRYLAGDLLAMESYRLHQIRPFSPGRDRISATLHGVMVDRDVWDTWF